MPNVSETGVAQEICSGTAKKLIHAAALAAALVPLGAIAADAAEISCVTSEVSGGSGGCFGVTGSYTASGGLEQSNIWKFFTDDSLTTLIYTFEIKGVPESDFELSVRDFVTTQGSLLEGSALTNFPNSVCIPTFDNGLCGLFDVFEGFDPATWDSNGYYVTITWFTNSDPLSDPPDDGNNYILQAKNASGGTIFTNQLIDTIFDPDPTPTDPALGGRGDSFSRFGGFRTAPEPSTLLLLGGGLATAMYRRRKRRMN